MTTAAIHFFSQLVYLNLPPQEGKVITVNDTVSFYLDTQAGQRLLKKRFRGSVSELELWRDMLKTAPKDLLSWQITDVLDDNAPGQTGFYGCTYSSYSGENVVAFRGSEMLGNPYFKNDYVNDFSLILCQKTPQHMMVDSYLSRYGCNLENLWITGHSLGGNLALYAAMAAPDGVRWKIQKVVTFNSPGFCKEFLASYQDESAELKDKIIIYQNQYDIISSILNNPVKANIVMSKFNLSAQKKPSVADVMYPHSNFMFEVDSAGDMVLNTNGEKSPLCYFIHILVEMIASLPISLRKELIEVTLSTIYSSSNGLTGRKAALDAAKSFLNRNLSNPEVKKPAIIAYGASLLMQQNPTDFLLKLQPESPTIQTLAKTLLLLVHILRP